jgi:hypothetical protein
VSAWAFATLTPYFAFSFLMNIKAQFVDWVERIWEEGQTINPVAKPNKPLQR